MNDAQIDKAIELLQAMKAKRSVKTSYGKPLDSIAFYQAGTSTFNTVEECFIFEEPKWRPFTAAELTSIIGRTVVQKNGALGRPCMIECMSASQGGAAVNIRALNETYSQMISRELLLTSYTFDTGEPCGVKDNS